MLVLEDASNVPVPCLRYKGTMNDGTEVAIKARLFFYTA